VGGQQWGGRGEVNKGWIVTRGLQRTACSLTITGKRWYIGHGEPFFNTSMLFSRNYRKIPILVVNAAGWSPAACFALFIWTSCECLSKWIEAHRVFHWRIVERMPLAFLALERELVSGSDFTRVAFNRDSHSQKNITQLTRLHCNRGETD